MQNTHYVYIHVDPRTDEVKYVGMGKRHRAWTCGSASNSRHPEHGKWMDTLLEEGYVPSDWTEIVQSRMTRESALFLEKSLIQLHGYSALFNIDPTGSRSFDEDDILLINQLRDDGLSYSKIAEEVGSTTMTVWRALN